MRAFNHCVNDCNDSNNASIDTIIAAIEMPDDITIGIQKRNKLSLKSGIYENAFCSIFIQGKELIGLGGIILINFLSSRALRI